MFEQWKKTALVMQILIACIIGVAIYRQAPLVSLLFLFILLEFASFFGAWWGARLKRRIDARTDTLPLQNRK